MLLRRFGMFLLLAAPWLAMTWVATAPSTVYAQAGDDDDDDDDDTVIGNVAGVVVDADGVLRKQIWPDRSGQLSRARRAAARSKLDPQVAARSDLRKVSLNRLEAALKARIDTNAGPDETMKYLAGLTRVEYVFFYPETNDIVIAGPAEGWVTDLSGRTRGIETGRPMILLDDLIVALRTFAPDKKSGTVISCSIDPTQEGLARMQAFLKQIGTRVAPTAENANFVVNGLRESLGLQNVRITGVPASTHFAQVLVEADYRMKLIGIGLERPPVKMVSFVDKATPASVSRNALIRWYFVPDYQCVRATEDNLAMQLVGDGVKLVGQDELVSSQGNRTSTGGTNRASQVFVESFTRKYSELAERSPVYAQLRNLIDLSIAAAFIQAQDYYAKAGWTMPVFGDENVYAVETQNAPQKVETAVTARFKGASWMTPIGGGVMVKPKEALSSENMLQDDEGKVAEVRQQIDLSTLAEGQWWWD